VTRLTLRAKASKPNVDGPNQDIQRLADKWRPFHLVLASLAHSWKSAAWDEDVTPRSVYHWLTRHLYFLFTNIEAGAYFSLICKNRFA